MQTFISRTPRKRFLMGFHNILNRKLKLSYRFNCILKNSFNWLSEKNGEYFWKGTYSCYEPCCKLSFNATIENKDLKEKNFIIHLKWNGMSNHQSFVAKKEKISGKERKKVAFEIMAEGIANVKITRTLNHFNSADIGKILKFFLFINPILLFFITIK